MAGGTWKSQNRRQPGVYINVRSNMKPGSKTGSRGIVAVCEPLSWGPEGQFMTITEREEDYVPYIGYGREHSKALFLREIFKGSDRTAPPEKLLLYRARGKDAQKATAASDIINASARYAGVRGNDISLNIAADPDEEGVKMVQTIVDGEIKDVQLVKSVTELKGNDWVDFGGEGTLAATAGIPLTGGTDGTADASAYAEFLEALEPNLFNVLIYDGTDETVQRAYAEFITRMREKAGRKCQAVMTGVHSDYEGIISVGNGVVLADGTHISSRQATWWAGGAEAGAAYNESLVYAQYPDAVEAEPALTPDQIDEALADGQLVFFREFDSVKVVSDINTLTAFTDEKNEVFSLNQIIRTIDTVANDIYKHFSLDVIGKTRNNESGRDLIKSWIVGYLNEIQANGGIQGFAAGDVAVEAGEAVNAVVITVAIQPVAAIEKIYITVDLTDE